jgi:hypothetical protein
MVLVTMSDRELTRLRIIQDLIFDRLKPKVGADSPSSRL